MKYTTAPEFSVNIDITLVTRPTPAYGLPYFLSPTHKTWMRSTCWRLSLYCPSAFLPLTEAAYGIRGTNSNPLRVKHLRVSHDERMPWRSHLLWIRATRSSRPQHHFSSSWRSCPKSLLHEVCPPLLAVFKSCGLRRWQWSSMSRSCSSLRRHCPHSRGDRPTCRGCGDRGGSEYVLLVGS